MSDWAWIIGQASQPAGRPAEQPIWTLFLPMVAIMAVFWLLYSRPKAKEQQKVRDMLAGMKKGDRVITIGGIIGTVTNIKDDEVTLKVDESNNTKMTLRRWAIKEIQAAESGSKPGGV